MLRLHQAKGQANKKVKPKANEQTSKRSGCIAKAHR